MATLLREIHGLKSNLLSAGGATIDTPVPPPGAADTFPIAARTVVQPDGDLLFFVADAYLADPEIRQVHTAQVAAWFAALEHTVNATAVALRRAAFTLMAIVSVTSAQAIRQSIVSGVVVAVAGAGVGFLVQSGLRLAVGYGFRRHGR